MVKKEEGKCNPSVEGCGRGEKGSGNCLVDLLSVKWQLGGWGLLP